VTTASPRPDLPLFLAPDGTAHVDRDGPSAETPRRWSRLHDPVVRRRRARVRAAVIGGGAVLLCVLGGAAGLAVTAAVWGPVGDGANLVGGAGVGLLVVSWILIGVLLVRRPSAEPDAVVRVPDDVLAAAPAGADSARLWAWSVASAAEAAMRPGIPYRLQIERPSEASEARAALEEYRRRHRDHVTACEEMGSVPREPAVPLDTRI
jgi:hypothetical protein